MAKDPWDSLAAADGEHPLLAYIEGTHANLYLYLYLSSPSSPNSDIQPTRSSSSSGGAKVEGMTIREDGLDLLEERLHARYTGTGHADTTKYEWLTHQHRDTLASIVGHPPLLGYLSIADGECQARERFELIEKMVQPCGKPPGKTDE
ncbi:splicing factor 3B subunit 5 [Kwoniella heveanensis CBS 569]|nr:splicing factor 3B subunit 5 [Kwoniella heveanensis CBS 569]